MLVPYVKSSQVLGCFGCEIFLWSSTSGASVIGGFKGVEISLIGSGSREAGKPKKASLSLDLSL